ncbi:MAG: tRNA pseudouridine(55) synthase TruB, partial [Collinsella sp.]|nr:tRNA pseudouridine(55) synthase TruB [Collinsella sp.]
MARRTPSQLNMLLAVDKPVGCTSHDVVSRCRRALHERRVGHAGTLDPMASGVMVVGVGQATRLLGMLTLDTKSYVADISFGAETNTDDAEGEAIRTVAIAPELRDPAYA